MRRWPLLLLIPLVDALVLVVVAAEFLGAPVTVLLVVLTGLVGLLLVRAEGRRTIDRMQVKLKKGEIPTDELMDGGMLIAAGAFLLTPGLVTDTLGFLLALPVSRVPIRIALKKYVVVPYLDERTGGFATGNVYTFGAPDDDGPGGNWGPGTDPGPADFESVFRSGDVGSGGPGPGAGSEEGSPSGFGPGSHPSDRRDGSDDADDGLGPDAYEIEFEDDDED